MTYKLPPLPEPSWPFGSKYNGKDMQAYAIAAIEAHGVPDDADVWCEYVAEMVGAYISEPVGSEKVKAIAGIIRRRMPQRFFASAPPAPQAEPAGACATCGALQDDQIIKQASVVQQEPTDDQIMATVGRKGFGFSESRPLEQQLDQVCELIRAVVRERYTHPAQQAKPQPLLSSEIWNNDAIMEVNADARLPYELIERFVRAVEAAHGITKE